MSDAPGRPAAERRVPSWPRRWAVLFRLHDYLLFDAPALLHLWVRSRADFWQYVMRVEESRLAREVALKEPEGERKLSEGVPRRGDWRTD